MQRLVNRQPSLAERRRAWTTLSDGVSEAPRSVSPKALLEAAIRALQKHSGELQEPSGPWLDHYSASDRSLALWTMFAAFGLPHEYQDYTEWVHRLPQGALESPLFPNRLDMGEFDKFLFWLWRGEKWSTAFWATKIADGTMLSAAEHLEDLIERQVTEAAAG